MFGGVRKSIDFHDFIYNGSVGGWNEGFDESSPWVKHGRALAC